MKDSVKDTHQTVGAHLRRERELRDIDLGEVSRVTRVRHAYLEAIEQESYGDLPADVYVRGYIRAYARFLGLDAEDCIERYARQSGAPKPGPAIRLAHTVGEPSSASPRKPLPALSDEKVEPAPSALGNAPRAPRRLGLALAIVLLLIAALTISIIYYVNRPGDVSTDERNTTTEHTMFDPAG